ncbi:MAG TPA: hypothetical protein DCX14_09520 [Flavobacteriales bacterium]|jgi:polyisoprenoid-binding protein YceI|nr:YceI family protein [Flavobacteriales bacterium]HAW20409.1 hypothetical protein [Flavobacteriales bacterium]
MNSKNLILTAALGSFLFAFTPITGTTKLKVKPEASKVEWYAEKVTGKHNGDVQLKSGTLEVENDQIVGGNFVIDMTTINTTDISGEYKDKLDGHLKSADFFDVDNHEVATYTITATKVLSDHPVYNTEITGDLTLKGKTLAISFPAKVEVRDDKIAAFGEMTIDRTKFDVKYGSASFFDSLGDKAIMDEFVMKISLGAKM